MTISRRGRVLLVALVAHAWLGSSVPAPAEATRPDARAVAREVFRDPEFWWKHIATIHGPDEAAPRLGFLERAGRGLVRAVRGFLRLVWPRGSPFDVANVTRYLVWVVLIVGLAFLVLRWRALWLWIRPTGGRAEPPASGGGGSTGLSDTTRLLEDAALALERGRADAAVRLGFLAVIAWLETTGLVPANPARTNREHLHALRHARIAGVGERFRRLALPYERVCYGERAATLDEAHAFLSDCRTLMAVETVPS